MAATVCRLNLNYCGFPAWLPFAVANLASVAAWLYINLRALFVRISLLTVWGETLVKSERFLQTQFWSWTCQRATKCAGCRMVATSPLALRWMRGSPRTECARRTTPYVCGANRVISSGDLCCCLLPQCEALRTCRSGFPIATKWFHCHLILELAEICSIQT